MNDVKERRAAEKSVRNVSDADVTWTVEVVKGGDIGTRRITAKKGPATKRSTVIRVAPKMFLYQHKIA